MMQGIPGVLKQHRAPDVLSGSEVERLLLACADLKHQAIFTLLYGAGFRVAELTALRPTETCLTRRLHGGKNTPWEETRQAQVHCPLPSFLAAS